MALATTYGDLSPRIGAFAEKEMLSHAEPILVLNKLAQTHPMPRNTGETLKMRRPVPLAPATTPLTEGVTPSASQFRYEDVSATLAEYGDWTELTNKITDLHEDPVGKNMAMILGEQAAETIEMITYGVIKAGTNVIYAAGAANRAAIAAPLTISEQRLAVRTLRANRAKKITSILGGSQMYSTKPIEAAYVAVTHSDNEAAIRKMPNFTPVAEYGSRQPICPEEIGSVEDVRYITSPLFEPYLATGAVYNGTYVSQGAANNDVYPVLFMGREAYGVVALKGSKAFGGAIKPMVRNPGAADSGDPMGRTGSVAWKTWFAAKILNDAWMVRVEVAAATDLS